MELYLDLEAFKWYEYFPVWFPDLLSIPLRKLFIFSSFMLLYKWITMALLEMHIYYTSLHMKTIQQKGEPLNVLVLCNEMQEGKLQEWNR